MDTHLHRAVGGNTTDDKVKACFCSPAHSSLENVHWSK